MQWPHDDVLGNTTLNVGMISGGQAINALPQEAEAFLMFRLTVEPSVITDKVRDVAAGRVDEIELYSANPPIHLTVVDGFETDVVSFNTDIPYFNLEDGAALLYGPGSIQYIKKFPVQSQFRLI